MNTNSRTTGFLDLDNAIAARAYRGESSQRYGISAEGKLVAALWTMLALFAMAVANFAVLGVDVR